MFTAVVGDCSQCTQALCLSAGRMLWRRLHLIYTIWRPQLLFSYTGDAGLQSHGHCRPIAFQCCTVQHVSLKRWVCAALEGVDVASWGCFTEIKRRQFGHSYEHSYMYPPLLSVNTKWCNTIRSFYVRQCIKYNNYLVFASSKCICAFLSI